MQSVQNTVARYATGPKEAIFLLALMMSLVALSIDIILPAMPMMARDLGLTNRNDIQLVLSVLFLGLGAGQIFYGPLSDSVGRKPAIYLGFVIFIAGSLISYLSTNFEYLLFGRLLQGFGAAGPRIVTLALVRDQYEGRLMARIMSIVMSIFIFVPAVAPSLGQWILNFSGWRDLYLSLFILAVIGLIWFSVRQVETLPKDKRLKFSFKKVGSAALEVLRNRHSLGYIICSGLISGGFVGYLNSTQAIFQDIYKKGEMFSIYFGVLALAIGLASFVNSKIVVKIGMESLCKIAARSLFAVSAFTLLVCLSISGPLGFGYLLGYMLISFFCIGFLFGNLNTLAIQPMGHIAGIASAVIGSLQTLISVGIGYFIGREYNETILPLLIGFTALSLGTSLLLQSLTKKSCSI